MEKIDKEVELYLEDKGICKEMPGYIEMFWNIKKKILKEVYNIEWKSPKEDNNDCIFN